MDAKTVKCGRGGGEIWCQRRPQAANGATVTYATGAWVEVGNGHYELLMGVGVELSETGTRS